MEDSLGKRIRELRKVYKDVIPAAKRTIESGKDLTPVAFALTPHGRMINGMSFGSYEEKRAVYQALGKWLRQQKASGAVLLNESWYLDQTVMTQEERDFMKANDNRMKTMPSQHPARKEMISVLLTTYGHTGLILHPFRREGGRIIWEPQITNESGPSQLVDNQGEWQVENYLFPAFEEGVH